MPARKQQPYEQQPYRGYIFISDAKTNALKLLFATIEPGMYAATNTWANAHKRMIKALNDRPNMYTVDGMRSIHYVLTYGKYRKVAGGPTFEDWILTRQDSLRWLESGVTEVVGATSRNKRPVKNTAGPHEAGITLA